MMHDLIQDMGVEIVRMEAPSKPGKRSRLFHHEDVLKVLTENSGSINIEGILLNLKRKEEDEEEEEEEEEEIEWSGRAFEKMKNLRILIIQNVRFSVGPNYLPNSLRVLEWEQYPSESLPCEFSPKKLALLSLPNSCVKLKKSLKKSMHLVDLRLSKCKFITHVSDMSGVPSLRQLILDGCENLIEIHESVGFLKHLTDLDVSRCTKLSSFLSSMWLPSLKNLQVEGCKKLERMPEIVGEMKMLKYLDLGETSIEELPQSIGNITSLKQLIMGFRKSLIHQKLCNMLLQKDLSLYLEASAQGRESFTRFQSIHLLPIICNDLGSLRLEGCGLTDEDLQLILKYCPFLYDLCVPWNHFVHLPSCIKESVHLRTLFVSECMMLKEIPELPSSTRNIEALNCPHLTSESTSVLWSKALKEETNLRIMVPEARIPDWFDHRCDGDTLSFWTRKNIPHIAMTFIFKEHDGILQWATPDSLLNIVFQFYINGHGELPGISMFFSTVAEDLTLLYDLNPGFIKQLSPDALEQDDWNHVEIKCTLEHFTTIECGVYVYKQETNMDDIQFNS